MILYTTTTAGRGGRTARKGDDECLHIELSAFGRTIGSITLETLQDATGARDQYLLSYQPYENERRESDELEAIIIEEGHRKEGVLQRAR